MAFERDPRKLFLHDYLLKYTIVPLVPSFVTPNSITVFRMVFTPVVLWFLYIDQYAIGVPLFIILAISDALDGSIARLRNKITKWGALYDPIADKILISSVVLLIVVQHVNVYFSFLIVALEVLIVIGALRHRKKGDVPSANIFGKTKMFFQVTGVSLLLIAVWLGYSLFIPFSIATLSLAIVFAIISLFTYGI